MEKLIACVFAFVTAFFTLTANPSSARADLPPAGWHCTSQTNCLCILKDNSVVIHRKGVTKEIINQVGISDGMCSASEGWVIVTRNSSTNVYMYELETGNRCSVDVGYYCTEGEVFISSEADRSAAFVVCPTANKMMRVQLNNCAVSEIGFFLFTPESITKDHERLYVANATEGTIMNYGISGTGGYGFAYTWQIGSKQIRYWNNGLDSPKLFFLNNDKIYSKNLPITDGVPDDFLGGGALTASGQYMTANNTHLFVSYANANNAVLYEILNPANSLILPVIDSMEVALSDDTAYVIELGNQVVVQAFDVATGNPAYTINEPGYSIAAFKPIHPPVCPNALVEPGEVCDGSDFDGKTCADFPGYTGGTLTCSVNCSQVFTSGCWSCGDGVMNPGELCDSTDFGTASCQDAGYENGSLLCSADCSIDYSSCYTCGNGHIEGIEQCEGADLQNATCESIGFVSGTLTCGSDCMFDTSGCSLCGNSVADANETCDGTDTPGIICQTFPGESFTGGQLACDSSCSDYDTSGCYVCGDGTVNTTEECDGANLNSQTCETLGYTGGSLACFGNCMFNIAACSGAPAAICGNGTVDALEECDDGDRVNGDGCDENCRLESLTCGNGVIDDPMEECDGPDLNDETCESLAWDRGVLFCGANCRFNTGDCKWDAGPLQISLTPNSPPKSEDLSGELLAEYQQDLGQLQPGCLVQTMGEDIVVTVEEGKFCNFEALDPATKKRAWFHLSLPVNALENAAPVVRFYKSGEIRENFGGMIRAVNGLRVTSIIGFENSTYRLVNTTQTYKVADGKKFLSVHPDPKTPIPGRWLRVAVGNGSAQFCTDETETNCAVLVGGKNGVAVINLDVLENMSQYILRVKDSGSGCSCSAGSSDSSLVFPAFVILFMLLAARRKNRARR